MTAATNNSAEAPAASKPPASNAAVPYHSSIASVALVASLFPLATFLWSLYVATVPDDGDDPFHLDYYHHDPRNHRYLESTGCPAANETSKEASEAQYGFSSTWEDIRSTVFISSSIGILCLLGYELFRRDPIVGKYVYDRKRLVQPERTPPPLMLSRSLWRGYDDDEEDDDEENPAAVVGSVVRKHRRSWCCKVNPALLEIIFLNLDPNYIRYSRAADEARKERERRGYVSCCRTGCFHDNCCSTHISGKRRRRRVLRLGDDAEGDGGFFIDEDGYAFYPGYSPEYSLVYQHEGDAKSENYSLQGACDASLVDAHRHSPPKWNRNIRDLFPEDHRRSYFANMHQDASRLLFHSSRDGLDMELGSASLRSPSSTRGSSIRGNVSFASGDDDRNNRDAGSPSSFQRLRSAQSNESEGGKGDGTVGLDTESSKPGAARADSSATSEDAESSDGDVKTPGIGSAVRDETEEELHDSAADTLGASSRSNFIGDVSMPSEDDEPNGSVHAAESGVTVTDDAKGKVDITSPLLAESSANISNSAAEVTEVGEDEHQAAGSGATVTEDVNGKVDITSPLLAESSAHSSNHTASVTEGGEDEHQAVGSGVMLMDDANSKVDITSPLLSESSASSINNTARVTELGEDELDNNETTPTDPDEEKPLRYPHRLLYICLPPGFHSWTNVFGYIGYFFCLPTFFRLCSKIPTPGLLLPKRGDGDNGRRGTVVKNPGMDLTEGEKELLRCAGLETYLLVRLARFGFDVTFYPFCASVVAVLPIYQSCVDENPKLNGYINLTITQIPNGDRRMIGIVFFTCMLYLYTLRRLWYEWEVFIHLRHGFLANGDASFHNSPTYLKTYRNTTMVECVPRSLRSDQNLLDVFESLFPGQIERAEMLIDTTRLVEVLKKRKKLIDKYDSLLAQYMYECWRFKAWQEEGKHVGTCTNQVAEPVKPKVRGGGLFSRKQEDAFAYYSEKIKEIDELANEEYDGIYEARERSKNLSIRRSQRGEEDRPLGYNARDIYALLVPSNIRQLLGEESQFFYGTGIVEFKSIAAKQSAVQCNLSGQPYWMITNDAPDPRDIYWSNIGVDRYTLETRKIIVQSILLLGMLGWAGIVGFINAKTNEIFGSINFAPNSLLSALKGYLPALLVSLVLLWLPQIFFQLARHVIRFKSHSQCDEFTMAWNTGYRLTNVFITLFSISLIDAIKCFKERPELFLGFIANGVINESSRLMNLIIIAAGQETMLMLLQWRTLIKQAVVRPLINLNSKSRRFHDSLNAPPWFEQSFLFGFFAPVLAYGLQIAMIYSLMSPIMLGICAVFFWIATKVHTHNALYVYCQRCEGGGKIFYYWNRIVFITLYSSIALFSAYLTLKDFVEIGVPFLVIMILVTYCIDKSVTNTFVVNSLHLPISMARIHDEEEDALIKKSHLKREGGENFMYRHPLLNQENWNSESFDYVNCE